MIFIIGLKESVGPVDFRDKWPLPDFSRAAKGGDPIATRQQA
jgi:hypothetical protein